MSIQKENMRTHNLTLTWKEQQWSSSKQVKNKKLSFQNTEEGTEPEDALNLIFDNFDKKFNEMQAQINNKMEPPIKKY